MTIVTGAQEWYKRAIVSAEVPRSPRKAKCFALTEEKLCLASFGG